MAIAKRKNGVPLINKVKASGHPITTLVMFNDVDWEFSEFTIDTTLGTGSNTVYYNCYGSNSVDAFDISLGDGTIQYPFGQSGSGLQHSHTYATGGAYTIRWVANYNSTVLIRNQSGQDGLFTTLLTDYTNWGWQRRTYVPWWEAGAISGINLTQPSATDKAAANGSFRMRIGSGITDAKVSVWGSNYKAYRLTNSQYNNQTQNTDFTGVTPDLSDTISGNIFNRNGVFNSNLDSFAPETRQVLTWNNWFIRAFAFNNGDPSGVSGGSIGTGWDTFNVTAKYAGGQTTSLTTNKLVDSNATFITDEVAVGMKVFIRYGRTQTTVASVDSETELTLNDDIFTSVGQVYSVTRSNIPPLATLMASNGSFNQVITSWDVTGQTSLRSCLGGGFNQDIRDWDISYVTNMYAFTGISFNFGFASGVANDYATSWDDRVYQVVDWKYAWGGGFNSDISGWTFGIPSNMPSGTNTTSTELKLVDSGATFVTDGVQSSNWRVTNMDTGKQAKVTNVDSETQLTLDTDIFLGTGENYEVFYGVSIDSCYYGSITWDISSLDTRCIYNMNMPFGNGTTAITADLGNWNMRNNTSLGRWFSASGGDKSSMVFNMRNWERGAIGDADYSTTRCNTSFQNFMYHAETANDIPMDNLDTRNVVTFSVWNQNGRWNNTPSNFCMKSCTQLTSVWYSAPEQFRARSWENWWQHPVGCNVRTNATNVFPNATLQNAVQIANFESTVTSSTTTGTGSDDTALIDSTATFITDGVIVTDMVKNVTTGKFAFVYSVDSETQITTSMDYFGTIGDSYEIVHGYNGQESYHGFLKLTAPIYNTIQATGNPTSIASSRLIDSGASFLTTAASGDEVKNTTTGLLCNVIRVVSDTELSLTANRFTDVAQGYSVERHAPNTALASGTTTSTGTLFQLIDSGATFLTSVREGDVVENTTDNTYTYIESIDSDTQLTLGNGIFVSGEGYSISGGFGWTVSNSDFYQVAGRTNYGVPTPSATVLDSDASFTTTVQVGWVFKNFQLNLTGTITAIVSDTELTLDTAASGASDGYAIDQPGIF